MMWSEYDSDVCSVARTMDVLQDEWTVLLLRDVVNGLHRFEEIRDHLGISRSVLARRLDHLVAHGVLERHAYRESGARERQEYVLTERGAALRKVLIALIDFGDRHLAAGGPPMIPRHRDCGAPVHGVLRCEAGHVVQDPPGVELVPGPGARRR
ncbi:winged helix-turn-helix transcriptional regulator [Euzebya tangerina]|uniref:winged helix-turn-helix transcriptional regulator n=1 Tax=Euzebya tangerina TaxID=591198 RepID=UPI000E31C3E1|nr:helix-turn-helix domain-containing protein [Euzebya tangerina]